MGSISHVSAREPLRGDSTTARAASAALAAVRVAASPDGGERQQRGALVFVLVLVLVSCRVPLLLLFLLCIRAFGFVRECCGRALALPRHPKNAASPDHSGGGGGVRYAPQQRAILRQRELLHQLAYVCSQVPLRSSSRWESMGHLSG